MRRRDRCRQQRHNVIEYVRSSARRRSPTVIGAVVTRRISDLSMIAVAGLRCAVRCEYLIDEIAASCRRSGGRPSMSLVCTRGPSYDWLVAAIAGCDQDKCTRQIGCWSALASTVRASVEAISHEWRLSGGPHRLSAVYRSGQGLPTARAWRAVPIVRSQAVGVTDYRVTRAPARSV